jgi:hypothetical protein
LLFQERRKEAKKEKVKRGEWLSNGLGCSCWFVAYRFPGLLRATKTNLI